MPQTEPVTLFLSYANEDEPFCQEFKKHLKLLERQNLLSTWYDRQITAGANWGEEIDKQLERASIIVLLISPDFLASDYCYSHEMQLALERHKQGLTHVIPILLRPVDWQDAPFSDLHCLPSNNTPVTLWENRDAAFLEVVTGIRATLVHMHSSVAVQNTSRSSSPSSHQARQRLLKRVRTRWIQDVLEQSLHHVALITLGLHEQPDALENPWRLMVQETERPARPLPSGTPIAQVYDEAEGALLILGEPGSGKTTLLLQLARELLDRAEQDEMHLMPVVFNLSSWAVKQQPLTDWLAEELNLRYQVPAPLAELWIATDVILPLLDGLDEVAPIHRAACLKEINTYRGNHTLTPLVVCSRSEEYYTQTARISLHNAVTIQPLTSQQIDGYLISAGEQLAALREVLHHDTVLLQLATTPLMLSILTLTYHGKTVEELPTVGSLDERRRKIFAAYVQRMFEHRGAVVPSTRQQTVDWLGWLASQMAAHSQTEFYLEDMQPDWLWGKFLRRCYEWTVGKPMIYCLWGWLNALYCGLLAVQVHFLVRALSVGMSQEAFGALLGIYPSALLISCISGILYGWRKGLYIAIAGLPIGVLVGMLISNAFSGVDRSMTGLIVGLVTGGTIGLLASIVGGKAYSGIFMEPVIGWSWKEVQQSFNRKNKNLWVASVLTGVSSILVGTEVMFEKGVFSGLREGGVILLGSLLLFSVYSGIQTRALDKRERIAPNQRIWRSVRKGLYSCLVIGMGAFLSAWLIINKLAVPGIGWQYALVAGLLIGITAGLFSDWIACIRHLALRILLWQVGSIPRNYTRFLDYTVERIFLRRTGGGYIFIHRQLLEYFARLTIPEIGIEHTEKVKPDTKDAMIYHNRGRIFAEFSEYQQALRNYTRAIELDPKEIAFYRDRGMAYARSKEFQQAIADYTSVIELDSKNAWAYRQRGIAYRELKEYEKAIADFTQTIKLEPERAITYRYRGWSYRLNKEYEKAIADFTQAIKLEPERALFYRDRGWSYRFNKESEKALVDFTRAIELAPQNVWLYQDRGSVYMQLEEYEKAIADFTRSIGLEPSHASLYSRRGSAFLQMKAYEQAIEDCTRAIELDATYKSAYYHRGHAHLWLKESTLAHADFVQYAALLPKSIYAAWMVISSGLGKQRPGSEIVEALEKIVAIEPQSGSAQFCQGIALGLQGNYSNGIVQLEQAIQLEKSIPDAYFWKGLFSAYLGQEGEAKQAITQALEEELPPILLTPLYWLEQERPAMYQAIAASFLAQYDI